MIGALRDRLDRFLGRGEAAVTVPPLDGALKPNTVLEDADVGIQGAAPDNLVLLNGMPVWSDGSQVLHGSGEVYLEVQSPITAMTVSTSGTLAVATKDNSILVFDKGAKDISPKWPKYITCVTALEFGGDTTLIACVGSTQNDITQWPRDLLEKGSSGQVLRLDTNTGALDVLAAKLAYPNGVIVNADGSLIISEAWRSQLVKMDANGQITANLLEDLPAYPARLARSARGGYWLSLFAPRSQLIEFVLREPAYRRAMMEEVDPEFWIAPALRSGYSFHEPMQGGALRQMGILKPWAPTRSYGLAVELDVNFIPIDSFHSRTGGKRHGITSLVESGGHLWLTSKGGGEVFNIKLSNGGAAS